MIKIFNTICNENPHVLDEDFKQRLYNLARKMVELEFNFIDMAFKRVLKNGEYIDVDNIEDYKNGVVTLKELEIELDWITKQEVKDFVMFTANRRLMQLGLDPIFPVEKNPFLWFDYLISGVEHANFFEQRGSDYQKVSFDMKEGTVEW